MLKFLSQITKSKIIKKILCSIHKPNSLIMIKSLSINVVCMMYLQLNLMMSYYT